MDCEFRGKPIQWINGRWWQFRVPGSILWNKNCADCSFTCGGFPQNFSDHVWSLSIRLWTFPKMGVPPSYHPKIRPFSGWWFGCHEFYFPINIGSNHHPNWRTHIFQRGWNQPPSRIGSWFPALFPLLIIIFPHEIAILWAILRQFCGQFPHFGVETSCFWVPYFHPHGIILTPFVSHSSTNVRVSEMTGQQVLLLFSAPVWYSHHTSNH